MTKVLLITCDEGAGHNWAATSPAIEALLEPAFDLSVVRNLGELVSSDIAGRFDAIVLHGIFGRNHAAEEAIERYVHAGRGLVVVHIASAAFEGSARFRRLVGRVWEYGGYPSEPFTSSHPPRGAFRIDIVDPKHPITAGMTAFTVEDDERYQDLLVAPDTRTHTLAEATLAGRTEPIAWIVLPPEGGRVFHLTLGHDAPTYSDACFRDLLLKGTRWAAGEGEIGAPRQQPRGARHAH